MMKDRRRLDSIFSIFVIILTPLFFIALATLIPLVFRPFYYMWVSPLKIPQESGLTRSGVIEAYNDIMNFIWRGGSFKAGSLSYTEAAKSHFQDCRPLFYLQLILVLIIGGLFIAYYILLKKKILNRVNFKGLSSFAYGGIVSLSILLIVSLFALINFDGLFTVFHYIFFPGKGNWTFNPDVDEIINIFPESYFLICAIFISMIVITLSTIVIVIGFSNKKKNLKELRDELRNSSSNEQ